jgi:hypothetical protein
LITFHKLNNPQIRRRCYVTTKNEIGYGLFFESILIKPWVKNSKGLTLLSVLTSYLPNAEGVAMLPQKMKLAMGYSLKVY